MCPFELVQWPFLWYFGDLESVIEKVTLKNQLFDCHFLGLILYDFPWFSIAVPHRFYWCCRISNRIAEKITFDQYPTFNETNWNDKELSDTWETKQTEDRRWYHWARAETPSLWFSVYTPEFILEWSCSMAISGTDLLELPTIYVWPYIVQ
jgi:hypothetical protein